MRPRTLERWGVTDIEVWIYSLILIRVLHSLGLNMSLAGFFLTTYLLSCIPRVIVRFTRFVSNEKKAQAACIIFFVGLTLGLIFDFPGLDTLLRGIASTFSVLGYILDKILIVVTQILALFLVPLMYVPALLLKLAEYVNLTVLVIVIIIIIVIRTAIKRR